MTQETEGNEHIIAYMSRRQMDVEARYTFLRNYVYACFMHASSLDIIYYLALLPLLVRLM